jgi:hypothetical protein
VLNRFQYEKHFIDKASYSGNVVLENFDLGTFLDRKIWGKFQ